MLKAQCVQRLQCRTTSPLLLPHKGSTAADWLICSTWQDKKSMHKALLAPQLPTFEPRLWLVHSALNSPQCCP